MKRKGIKGVLVIKNDRGLHTRPSTEIVKCATRYRAEIKLVYKDMEVNARSLLGILSLAAEKGARIPVYALGIDAKEAVEELVRLSEQKFNITY